MRARGLSVEALSYDGFASLSVSSGTEFRVEEAPDMLGGIDVIKAEDSGREMTFIPYLLWDNRGPGCMKVWVDYID